MLGNGTIFFNDPNGMLLLSGFVPWHATPESQCSVGKRGNPGSRTLKIPVDQMEALSLW